MGLPSPDQGEEVVSSINIVPLVDVVLVLLIIFMVTASYIVQPSIEVDLPSAASAEEVPQTTLALVLTRAGTLYLNGEQITLQALPERIKPMLAEKPDLQAVIGADETASHGAVVKLIDVVKLSGVTRFALNTEDEFLDPNAQPAASPAPEAPNTP